VYRCYSPCSEPPLTCGTQWNIQFYNQGMYTDCNGLLTQSASPFPNTALFQLASAGWVANKLVIGKPAVTFVSSSLSLGGGRTNTRVQRERKQRVHCPGKPGDVHRSGQGQGLERRRHVVAGTSTAHLNWA
jgi:hypothetical protein